MLDEEEDELKFSNQLQQQPQQYHDTIIDEQAGHDVTEEDDVADEVSALCEATQ